MRWNLQYRRLARCYGHSAALKVTFFVKDFMTPGSSLIRWKPPTNKKKRRISPPLLLWHVPSPRHSAKVKFYCSGDVLVVQVASDVALKRTTASPKEQKYRTPVWFGVNGVAMNV
jgi:hypothetical protein